jgi:hypothetical protein
VQSRVELARKCFQAGRNYLARVQNPRCRLAGFAYTARFEWLLDTIEQENYLLRSAYQERKSLTTGWRMVASVFSSLIGRPKPETFSQPIVSQSWRKLKDF